LDQIADIGERPDQASVASGVDVPADIKQHRERAIADDVRERRASTCSRAGLAAPGAGNLDAADLRARSSAIA
jgi:hypothetical protein